jgi:hypothetical protein
MTDKNQAYIDTFLAELERVAREVERSDISRAVNVLFDTWQRHTLPVTLPK